jgi:8-hydroxy-5-deazaflavin:NADPH oxidoreductase
MKTAIIGHGAMGAGLARALAAADIDLVIGARDAAKAAALARELGPRAEGVGIAEAFKRAVGDALKAAGDTAGKVIVDISNPITPDFKGLVVGHTTSAAEAIQALAPDAAVVKAFNTIFAQLLPAEARKTKTLQIFVAGNDAGAKEAVSKLAKAIGFEPVDAGPLSNSRFLEPIGEMNIHFGFFLGRGLATAPAWVAV